MNKKWMKETIYYMGNDRHHTLLPIQNLSFIIMLQRPYAEMLIMEFKAFNNARKHHLIYF